MLVRLDLRFGVTLPKLIVRATSALPLIATEERTSRDVSNVPATDSRAEARGNSSKPPYRCRTQRLQAPLPASQSQNISVDANLWLKPYSKRTMISGSRENRLDKKRGSEAMLRKRTL